MPARSTDTLPTAALTTLVVTEALRPPLDEAGTMMAVSFIDRLDGEKTIINWSDEAVEIPDARTRTVRRRRTRVGRCVSRIAFWSVSVGHALRHQPDSIVYVPLCAPGALRQAHALMLSMATREFVEILFQTRPPSRHLRWLSRFPVSLASPTALREYASAGFRVLPFDPHPNVPLLAAYDRRSLRQRYGYPTDRPLLLHIGHSTPGRGLGVLSRLAELRPDIDVLVRLSSRGSGEELEERANVRVVRSFVEDVFELYAIADAYVFPLQSLHAAVGLPLSLLEAMTAGLPILCTDLPHLHEVVDGYPRARFFPPGVDEAAVHALSSLVSGLGR